jgi:DNA polymerase
MDGRWIMPIFHPSYLLRNPSKKPGAPKSLMWDDIREVRQKYDVLK